MWKLENELKRSHKISTFLSLHLKKTTCTVLAASCRNATEEHTFQATATCVRCHDEVPECDQRRMHPCKRRPSSNAHPASLWLHLASHAPINTHGSFQIPTSILHRRHRGFCNADYAGCPPRGFGRGRQDLHRNQEYAVQQACVRRPDASTIDFFLVRFPRNTVASRQRLKQNPL